MNSYQWSPEERRILIAMRAEGATLKDVSERTGRSLKAISNYIKRNNLKCRGRRPNPPKPDPVREEVVASSALLAATLEAIGSFAARNRISETEARALLIGAEPRRQSYGIMMRPLTDCTGHRPGEVIARPIGKIVTRIVEGITVE